MEIHSNLRFKAGVYSIFNTENGKRYIGSSKDLYNRLHEHYHNLRFDKSHNKHLQNAWDKYGKDKFIFNILEFCDEDVRFEREQYYIDLMKPEYNFSLQVQANTNRVISNDIKQKISNTLKEKYATGELKPFIRKDIQIHNYVYDIINWKLAGIFSSYTDTAKALQVDRDTISTTKIAKRIYCDKYIIVTNKFDTVSELKNHFYQYFMQAKTTIERIKYIVAWEEDSNLIYFRSYAACAKYVQCSPETLRNHTDATIDNPYIVSKSGYNYCVLSTFVPIIETAVPIEESLELLQTNIGESPEKDNTEISVETKESIPSYSVEIEPSLEE